MLRRGHIKDGKNDKDVVDKPLRSGPREEGVMAAEEGRETDY